jgi:hypothetical protein
MRVPLLVALMLLLIAPQGKAGRHSSFRAHAEANASSGPVFSNQLQLFGRTVTLEKMPALSDQDVVGFRSYRAADGSFGVLFELNEHGRLSLDTLSIDRRGSSLFVFVNGRAITALQIDRRVSDGKLYIPSGLTATDVALLAKDWPAKPKK